MPNLILSAKNTPSVLIAGKGANKHSKLINLGFDESGHTGFQRELTAEQLANIDAVQNKEDVSNKIQSLKLATGDEAQYPSAKAVVDEIFRVDNDLNLANDRITILETDLYHEFNDRINILEKDVSDIGGALDAIIAIQNSLIGGDGV